MNFIFCQNRRMTCCRESHRFEYGIIDYMKLKCVLVMESNITNNQIRVAINVIDNHMCGKFKALFVDPVPFRIKSWSSNLGPSLFMENSGGCNMVTKTKVVKSLLRRKYRLVFCLINSKEFQDRVANIMWAWHEELESGITFFITEFRLFDCSLGCELRRRDEYGKLDMRWNASVGKHVSEALDFLNGIGVREVNLHPNSLMFNRKLNRPMITEFDSNGCGVVDESWRPEKRKDKMDIKPVLLSLGLLLFEINSIFSSAEDRRLKLDDLRTKRILSLTNTTLTKLILALTGRRNHRPVFRVVVSINDDILMTLITQDHPWTSSVQ